MRLKSICEKMEIIRIFSVLIVFIFCLITLLKQSTIVANASATYCWPVETKYKITCGMYYSKGGLHGATDFGVGVGTPVFATASGKVITAKDNGCQGSHNSGEKPACPKGSSCGAVKDTGETHGSYGNWIVIDHGNNVYSWYCHLQTGSFKVKVGSKVEQGQQIANSGAAGNTYGAHLHFEMRMNGNSYNSNRVDPQKYLTKVNVKPSKIENSSAQTYPAGQQTISDGDYHIVSALGNDRVMAVSADSKNSQANVLLWTSINAAQSVFHVKYLNNGYYEIWNTNSGMSLDVAVGADTDALNLWQYNRNSTDAQKWVIEDCGDGTYFNIISKCNSKCIDVSGGLNEPGRNIQVYNKNGTAAQKWKFVAWNDKSSNQAQSISDGDYHIVSALDNAKALTVSGNSIENSANVHLWGAANSADTVFHVKYLNDGYYEITYTKSNKVLDTKGAKSARGTNLQQYARLSNDAQKWIIRDCGDHKYFNIISKCNGLYVDVKDSKTDNGTNIQLWLGNGGNAQKWKFVAWGADVGQTISDGDYHIVSAVNNNMVMTVGGPTKNDGENIQLWNAPNTANQVFHVHYLNNGYYEITSNYSGKSIDVAGAKNIKGTNLQQFSLNGNDAQKWIIRDCGDHKYFNIISKCNGLYVDVKDSKTDNGTNIQLWLGNGGNAQKWKFVAWGADVGQTVSDGDYHIVSAVNNNMVMTVGGPTKNDGENIQLWNAPNTANQVFHVHYLNNGYYEITSNYSGKSIDVAGAKNVKGTNLQQCALNGNDAQKWIIRPTSDGRYFNIISKCNGLSVDVVDGKSENGTNIRMWLGNTANAQKWRFVAWGADVGRTISDGDYHIVSQIGKDYSRAMTIKDNSVDSGANVQLWKDANSPNTVFHVKYIGNGYYEITSIKSGKCLDVYDDRSANKTNLIQHVSNGNDNQRWIIKPSGDGEYFNIISKSSGLYVDVAGAGAEDGTNIWMYLGNGGGAQKWKFIPWVPSYPIDLNRLLDNEEHWELAECGTVDIYINGKLDSDDVSDYYKEWPVGTKYEVRDIKTNSGYRYVGVHNGNSTGTVGNSKVDLRLAYTTAPNVIDLNCLLDDKEYSSLGDCGTVDIYINGKLDADDVADYYKEWPKGTTYEIRDIKTASSYKYTGIRNGETTGVVDGKNIDLRLIYIKKDPPSDPGPGTEKPGDNQPGEEQAHKPGDVNHDGQVKLNDAILLRRYTAGWDVEIDMVAADVNGDGSVKLNDSILLRRYVAGWDVVLK